MQNKIIKTIDNKGRLVVPKKLEILANIKIKEDLVFCEQGEDILILKKEEVKDQKVIWITQLDSMRRLLIPKDLRGKTKRFEIFVRNGNLIIKEEE